MTTVLNYNKILNIMKYKFLEDLTSDVMFESYGKTFEKLLENTASAMFSVVCDINHIEPKKSIKIELSSECREDLLYDWLSKLLSQSEINNLFLSKFEVKLSTGDKSLPCAIGNKQSVDMVEAISESPLHLFGIAYGEPISQEKSRTVVKGVTYYKFSIKESKSMYKARVTLDI